jgi:two-component system, OmpR family, response regulator
MNPNSKIKLFLVDDDTVFLKSLEIEFLQHADFTVRTCSTGEDCMQHISEAPDIIILDYHLDGVNKQAMNGLQTLDEIKHFNRDIPVIMLSSQDKIDVAISCMHHLASDYVIKSETSFFRLQKIITTLSDYKKIKKELNWYMERM